MAFIFAVEDEREWDRSSADEPVLFPLGGMTGEVVKLRRLRRPVTCDGEVVGGCVAIIFFACLLPPFILPVGFCKHHGTCSVSAGAGVSRGLSRTKFQFVDDADFLQMVLELKDLVDKNIFTKVSTRLMLQYIRGTRDTQHLV